MASVHARSSSTDATESRTAKKTKTSHGTLTLLERLDPTPRFSDGLFEERSSQALHDEYKSSSPYLHAVVEKLFQDDLLTSVKDEIIGQLNFTEKETDIYKVHQTGDLASLSYLDEAQLSLLPNLLVLRDALYSPNFRAFVRKVTGCGPLSGIKTDMSVNSYKEGCHLLNHDDVIGTRRVSYILYMPLPKEEEWKREWGGSLELYPVKDGENGVPEPECVPSKVIPPSWNQFVFFEVQPGHSFHSVEEVVVDEGGKNRQRLSISGWFHKAQEGEEEYEEEAEEKQKSSLEQLTSISTTFIQYPDAFSSLESLPSSLLSNEDVTFLSKFLNPIYLQERTLEALSSRFAEESSCELHTFLCESLAKTLETGLREQDKIDCLDASREGRIPPHTAGVGTGSPWSVCGPPHKARYCILRESTLSSEGSSSSSSSQRASQILHELQTVLFPSTAFRAWLARASMLLPLGHNIIARRFRPGLDYTLATGDENESRLDVVLGLTPRCMVKEKAAKGSKGKGKARAKVKTVDWEDGEWGGWECYMAQHEGEEDPAVYRSGPSKSSNHAATAESSSSSANANGSKTNGSDSPAERDDKDTVISDAEEIEEDEEEEDEEDSGTLLTVQPGFNRLLLVLRDEGVMRFVKYVSARAGGSRYDVCGELEVGMVQDEEEGDENQAEGEGED